MAAYKAVRIMSWIYSDGTTNSITIKLATDGDPYWVAAQHPAGYGGHVANWFSQPNAANAPKAAKMISGMNSLGYSVPNSILTINFTPKPKDERQEFVVDLLFA